MLFRPLWLTLAGMLSLFGSQAVSAGSSSDYSGLFVVEERPIESQVVLGGTVVPARLVTIAAQLPGRVEYIAGIEGDVFRAGQLLVRLGDAELRARREAALAQVRQAEAALRDADVQFTRELVNPWTDKQMPGMGTPSLFDSFFTRPLADASGSNDSSVDRHADLVTRQTGIEQARSAYAQARAMVEAIDVKLKDAKGVAPFDGVIAEKWVEVGDTVQPGQPLLDYADTASLDVVVNVPTRLMPGVHEGLAVPVRLDVLGTPVPARVSQIFPVADTERYTVKVKLRLPKSAPAAPGMYAEVVLKDASIPAQLLPIIPISAIMDNGSLPSVLVVNAQGKTERRLLRLGEALSSEYVSVLSGLRSGERVVRHPQPQ